MCRYMPISGVLYIKEALKEKRSKATSSPEALHPTKIPSLLALTV